MADHHRGRNGDRAAGKAEQIRASSSIHIAAKVASLWSYRFMVLHFSSNGDQSDSNSPLIAWAPIGLSLERSGVRGACGLWQPQQMVLDQILESGQRGRLAMRILPWLCVLARLQGHWSSDRLLSLSLVTIWPKQTQKHAFCCSSFSSRNLLHPIWAVHDLMTNGYVIATAVCSHVKKIITLITKILLSWIWRGAMLSFPMPGGKIHH